MIEVRIAVAVVSDPASLGIFNKQASLWYFKNLQLAEDLDLSLLWRDTTANEGAQHILLHDFLLSIS